MFRQLFTALIAIFLVASVVVTGSSATTAQDSPSGLLKLLPGLETAHARGYRTADDLHIPIATPVAEASPLATGPTPGRMEATVLEFENEDAARFALTMVQDDGVLGMLTDHGVTVDDLARIDFGDLGLLWIGESDEDGEADGTLLILDGAYGFIITASGPAESIEPALTRFAEFVVAAEPGADEIVVDEFGMASGGTFEILPGVDDPDVLAGLMPLHDYDLLVSDEPLEPTSGS